LIFIGTFLYFIYNCAANNWFLDICVYCCCCYPFANFISD
jgi:hypothetical protein